MRYLFQVRDIERRFYTTEEAARLSRFSLQGLAARRHRRQPPEWRKIGGKVVYPIKAFEAWLQGEISDENDDDGSGSDCAEA